MLRPMPFVRVLEAEDPAGFDDEEAAVVEEPPRNAAEAREFGLNLLRDLGRLQRLTRRPGAWDTRKQSEAWRQEFFRLDCLLHAAAAWLLDYEQWREE